MKGLWYNFHEKAREKEMTTEELEKIIARHEMQCLELKESFNVECIETACAFTNAQGGFIVIGVDNDGNPSKRQLRLEGLRDYENKISTATEPSVNHQMTPVEIAECHLKSTGSSMDAVFVPDATKDDLDMDVVRKYMRKAVMENRRAFAADEDPWRALMKLGLVKSETEITRAAYLLFARNPQQRFSQAVIHAGAFKAEGAVILDSHDSRGNIQDQVEDALAFIQRNIRCAIVVTGKAEHDRYWEYPIEGLREALANAVCHRDYGLPNNIQVKILEDRIVIMNPGQLPFDMSLEQLEDPDHPSRPRNKLIAQVFYDMHVIEQYGSGIRRINSDCDMNGSPCPVLKSENGEFIIKFLARTKESASKLGIDPAKFGVLDKENVATSPKTGPKGRFKILELLRERPKITIADLVEETRLSRNGVKWNIDKLKGEGLVRRVGPAKGGHWEVVEP